jgi:acetolactate synthase small subunit
MTNQETIEKLNDALNQLIDAYEVLQLKHQETIEKLEVQTTKNKDLEFKLSDLTNVTDKREDKMDGMLSKIQKLLSSPKTANVLDNSNNYDDNFEDTLSDNILDIKLSGKDHKIEDNTAKIDFGRMESLLNGLNK